GRNFDVPHLWTGGVIRSNRRIHDNRIEPSECQIDELLKLPAVTSDQYVSDTLNVAFGKRHTQHTGREAAQIIGSLHSRVVGAGCDRQCRIKIRIGEVNLFCTLWSDLETIDHNIVFTALESRHQPVPLIL